MYGGDEGGERGEKRRAVSCEGERNRILGTVSLGRRLAFFLRGEFFRGRGDKYDYRKNLIALKS